MGPPIERAPKRSEQTEPTYQRTNAKQEKLAPVAAPEVDDEEDDELLAGGRSASGSMHSAMAGGSTDSPPRRRLFIGRTQPLLNDAPSTGKRQLLPRGLHLKLHSSETSFTTAADDISDKSSNTPYADVPLTATTVCDEDSPSTSQTVDTTETAAAPGGRGGSVSKPETPTDRFSVRTWPKASAGSLSKQIFNGLLKQRSRNNSARQLGTAGRAGSDEESGSVASEATVDPETPPIGPNRHIRFVIGSGGLAKKLRPNQKSVSTTVLDTSAVLRSTDSIEPLMVATSQSQNRRMSNVYVMDDDSTHDFSDADFPGILL